jgi:type IV pilus assembly protein PilN
MIRINLLPRAKRQTSEGVGVQVWGITYLVSAVIWSLALAFVYFSLNSELEQQTAANAELERQIKRVKSESGNLEDLKKELDKSKKLGDVVKGLLDARQGPARMLLELSAILSPGRGPSVDPKRLEELRKVSPEAGFTPGWDPHRLWLTGFVEENRGCRITGVARNNEDIAEFLRRLTLSQLFEDVVLVRTGDARAGGRGDVPGVGFELTCKVRY